MGRKTVTVRKPKSPSEYICLYDGQEKEQQVLVVLDCPEAVLYVDYDGVVGNGVPMEAYHGHVRRWGIPSAMPEVIGELLDDLLPLAQRVVDDYESQWDGSNHVASFTDDARAALAEIDSRCMSWQPWSGDLVVPYAPDEWLAESVLRWTDEDGHLRSIEIDQVCTILADTPDSALELNAKNIEEAAKEDEPNIHFTRPVLRYLEELRDEVLEERRER